MTEKETGPKQERIGPEKKNIISYWIVYDMYIYQNMSVTKSNVKGIVYRDLASHVGHVNVGAVPLPKSDKKTIIKIVTFLMDDNNKYIPMLVPPSISICFFS